MNDSILRVENISMCFGGVVAVDNVSFEVKKRTIHSLIGPNGAGKTSLMRIMTLLQSCTSGTIYFDDYDIAKDRKAIRSLENTRMNLLVWAWAGHFRISNCLTP